MRTYGESEPEPTKRYLRGELYRVYDQAGIETNYEYDFTGTLITKRRQLAVNYSSSLDWNDPSNCAFHSEVHTETSHTNALGPISFSQALDGSAQRHTYNDTGLPEMIETNIKRERDANGSLIWNKYVTGV